MKSVWTKAIACSRTGTPTDVFVIELKEGVCEAREANMSPQVTNE